MYSFGIRPFTTAEAQNCSSTAGALPTYRFIFDKTEADIAADVVAGWRLFWINSLSAGATPKINSGVEYKGQSETTICLGGDQSFISVGQAKTTTSTTEFMIRQSWTYGEIAQTAMLFILITCAIFALLYNIFKKKTLKK